MALTRLSWCAFLKVSFYVLNFNFLVWKIRMLDYTFKRAIHCLGVLLPVTFPTFFPISNILTYFILVNSLPNDSVNDSTEMAAHDYVYKCNSRWNLMWTFRERLSDAIFVCILYHYFHEVIQLANDISHVKIQVLTNVRS